MQLSDTWADGPGLHITADGWIDLGRYSADMNGSLAWEGRIMRYARKLPLIGRLLTGKNREGLFATKFQITGPLGDPTVEAEVLGSH